MADITLNLKLTTAWQNVSSELSLANSTTYLTDIMITGKLDITKSVNVVWAKTNNTTAPTDALVPHPWSVFAGRLSAQGRFTQNANENIWMKTIQGEATLVMTKT